MPTALTTNIPQQPLALALEDFSRQTTLQVVYLSEILGDRRTHGAPAGMAPADALPSLLRGTGLKFEYLNPRIVRILATTPRPKNTDLDSEQVVVTALAIRDAPRIPPASQQELRLIEAANEQLEQYIARSGLLYGNAALDRYLQDVAERILRSEAETVRVQVVKGTSASAISLSNGSIYVTTALLASLDDESELAAVLSRELTHYTNAHVLRSLQDERRWEASGRAGLLLLGFLSGTYPVDLAKFPQGTLGILKRASVSGYSLDLELEADAGGMRRMIAAGYDASGALTGLHHLRGPAERSTEAPIYASHAKLGERIASYRELLAGKLASLAAAGGERRREQYRVQLGQLPLDQVTLWLECGKFDRAEAALELAVAAGDSGRAEFLRGEIARRRVPQSDAADEHALAAYVRAISLPDAPAATYRELGLLRRLHGESAGAAVAFESYLERAPLAADAPLIRRYLENTRGSAVAPSATVTAR